MDTVAEESGAGRQTVYNQFASKRALFDATLGLLWDRMSIGSAIAEFWVPEETVAFLRMIISESIHFPELAESFFTFGRGSARRAIVAYLRTLRDSRGLNIPDPDLAAAQFIGLINEPLLSSRVIGAGKSPSKERRKHVVQEAVHTLLARYQ